MNLEYVMPINTKDEFVARVQVKNVRFQKNGFCICEVRDTRRKIYGTGISDTYVIKGDTIKALIEGHIYLIKAQPKYNQNYNIYDFNIISAYETNPENRVEINNLMRKSIKTGVITVLSDESEVLEEVRKNVLLDKVVEELVEIGMNFKDAKRYVIKNGIMSAQIIKANPYILLDETTYVDFNECDIIADMLHHGVDSPIRIIAAVRESIKEYQQRTGNTFAYVKDILPVVKSKLDYFLSLDKLREIEATHTEDFFDYQVFNFDNMMDLDEVKKCISLHKAYPFYQITDDAIMDEIKSPNHADRVVYDSNKGTIMLEEMDMYERLIASKIKSFMDSKACPTDKRIVNSYISIYEKMFSMTLTDNQKEAIKMALGYSKGGFYIINGSAGTGKTTVVKAIIYALGSLLGRKPVLDLMAPTGRASQVLTESTGFKACTIHRRLCYNPDTGSFEINEKNPIQADLIIIDEVSMLDTELCYHLLNAIDSSTKVIFLGDDRQLPSVSAGRVLSDILESHKDVITLTEVKRNGSGILDNALAILNGKELISSKNSAVVKYSNISSQIQMIKNACVSALKHFDRKDIEVLLPMKVGPIGTFAVNNVLQPIFNPNYNKSPKIIRKKNGNKLCVGDKVINIKNLYDVYRYQSPKVKRFISSYNGKEVEENADFAMGSGVMNGEIGEIVNIYDSCVEVTSDTGFIIGVNEVTRVVVRFKDENDVDSYVFFDNEEDNLELAYAITIHKSQGSTFPCTITCVNSGHRSMISNELLYVSATRASKLNCFIIDENTYTEGVAKFHNKRDTYLATKIKKVLK